MQTYMNRAHNPDNQNQPKNKCASNYACSVCKSEKLSVNCGCEIEAKQYEYNRPAA